MRKGQSGDQELILEVPDVSLKGLAARVGSLPATGRYAVLNHVMRKVQEQAIVDPQELISAFDSSLARPAEM